MIYVMSCTLCVSVHIQTQDGGCFPIPSSYRTCARAVPHCDPPVPIHSSNACYYAGGTLNLSSCNYSVYHYMYVCMYVRMYICMYVCLYVCMYIYVCMYFVFMYVCMFVCICMYLCVLLILYSRHLLQVFNF